MTEITIEPIDVSVEAALLKLLSKKQYYNQYINIINKNRLLPSTKVVLDSITKYYQVYPNANIVDYNTLYTHFAQDWQHDLSDNDIEYYRNDVFPKITKAPREDVLSCLESLNNSHTIDSIRKTDDISKIRELLRKHEEKDKVINVSKIDPDVFSIKDANFTLLDKSKGIPWFLRTLRDKWGGIIPEQFIVISADSNVGKGAFCISQAAHTIKYFKQQGIKKSVLYFNSESSETFLFARLCSQLFKEKYPNGKQDIINNMKSVVDDFMKEYGEHAFYSAQIKFHNIEWIHSIIKKYDPGLVIIDLLDSLSPDLGWESLTRLYTQVRLIADEYYPIIGTTQAGNTSYFDKEEGEYKSRKFLTDKDTAGSKFGKSGAAESIITIGKDDQRESIRYVSLVKDKDGVGNLRITCELEEKYSLYKELSW